MDSNGGVGLSPNGGGPNEDGTNLNGYEQPGAIISSTGDESAPQQRSILGGRARRDSMANHNFQATQQNFVPNDNAPKFFNDAMRDSLPIAPVPEKSGSKKWILIAVIAVVILGVAGLLVVVMSGGGSSEEDKMKAAFNADDIVAISGMESVINDAEKGDINSTYLWTEELMTKYKSGVEAYERVSNAISGYKEVSGLNITGTKNRMSELLPKYKTILVAYEAVYDGILNNKSEADVSKIKNSELEKLANRIVGDYSDYYKARDIFRENKCKEIVSDYCNTLEDNLESVEDRLKDSNIAKDFFIKSLGSDSYVGLGVADDLNDIFALLNSEKGKE